MKIMNFFFVFFLCFFADLNAQSLNVSVRAKSAILFNPENHAILFEKRAHDPHYPASVIKIATALFVLDQKKWGFEQQFVASENAVKMMHADIKQSAILEYPSYLLEHDAVTMGLQDGEVHSFNTLLHSMLLHSTNDAANVIAENLSGSIEQFMQEMNVYYRDRGIVHSNFMNPHGLLHPAQITTAYEMAKIAGLAFENEEFRRVIGSSQFSFPNSEIKIKNRNPLIKKGKYHYAKAIGGKTGYIAKAGSNLVACAEDKGRRLIAVLFGYKKRAECFEDAIALFETAFREKKKKRLLFSKENDHFSKYLRKGLRNLKAHLAKDVEIEYFPSEESKLETQVVWDQLKLPIAEGDKVGNLVVKNVHDHLIFTAPLFAIDPVEKAFFYRFLERVKTHKFLSVLILGAFIFSLHALQRKKKGAKIFKG